MKNKLTGKLYYLAGFKSGNNAGKENNTKEFTETEGNF